MDRTVLYKKGQLLAHCGYFLIEISRFEDRLIISAFDVETPNSFVMTAKSQRANQVLQDFDCNFDAIAKNLTIKDNKRLCLQMPQHLRTHMQKSKLGSISTYGPS